MLKGQAGVDLGEARKRSRVKMSKIRCMKTIKNFTKYISNRIVKSESSSNPMDSLLGSFLSPKTISEESNEA